MSDLISRKEVISAIDKLKEIHFDRTVVLNKVSDKVNAMPAADIMECARAIKEYCKSKPDNVFLACFKCPFFAGTEKNEESVCELFLTPPHEWDLPEGEKGGAE